ncbi:hypothetical protein BJF84_13390 [Rhodococcus sp. CUA-806]|jgi:hypothetical protein|nr:hypothetical protein BJF84_13390 [Rhodococcus sp. CUA-806]
MTRIYFELAMPEFVGSFDATEVETEEKFTTWDVEIRTYADESRTTFRLHTHETDPWKVVGIALARYMTPQAVTIGGPNL